MFGFCYYKRLQPPTLSGPPLCRLFPNQICASWPLSFAPDPRFQMSFPCLQPMTCQHVDSNKSQSQLLILAPVPHPCPSSFAVKVESSHWIWADLPATPSSPLQFPYVSEVSYSWALPFAWLWMRTCSETV